MSVDRRVISGPRPEPSFAVESGHGGGGRVTFILWLIWSVIAAAVLVSLVIGVLVSEDVHDFANWVFVMAGVLWMLVPVVSVAVTAVLWFGTRKGASAVNGLFDDRLRPMLAQVHAQVAAVRDATSRLPGNQPVIEGEARPVPAPSRPRLPFRRKRRWYRR